jgi:DNA repair protein RecO
VRDPGSERVAIVVGRQDWGETDRILRLVTAEEGRVGAFQRGGQKRDGGLDVGVRARVRWRARNEGLVTLTGAEVEDARLHLRGSFARLALSQYACALTMEFVHEGQPDPRQFALLETALLVLDHASADPQRAFLAAFELKVLTFAGVAPEIIRASPRLEECRRARMQDQLDSPLEADAEALVYAAICEQLGRDVKARALVDAIAWAG